MTVYIEKPAVNLREELASLRNQGGYQEQQFYFDGLVTNGTFDADTSGWTTNGTISVVSGELRITHASNQYAYTSIKTVVGSTYVLELDVSGGTGTSYRILVGISGGNGSVFTGGTTTQGTAPGSIAFTATATTHYISIQCFGSGYQDFDNISVFEVDASDDVIHTMPTGWKPKDVFEDGLLQREGSGDDYEVIYDGFTYKVKPTVAPSATTQTCVIGVKA